MFGDLLRTARVELGLTQAELARLAETSQPSVSDYESGRVSPTLEVAERLLAVLGRNLATGPEWTAADRRSLGLARVYARRLLEDPERVRAIARQNLDRMRGLSPHIQPWVHAWEGVLRLPIHVLADLLVDDGEFARAMRSTNPFAGVASEQERLAALEADSSRVA
jgi:transcriptional regulator with XRE-family HTH domain